MLLKPKELENAVFSFSCGQKTFCKRSLSKPMLSRYSCTVRVAFLVPHAKHLMRFQIETSVFKFLRRSVNLCSKTTCSSNEPP